MRREIVRAGREHRGLLRQLFELYAYDFSAWNGEDVDDAGRFTPDDFLTDGWGRRGGVGRYLLRVDGRWAGFALVERGSYVEPGRAAHLLMDEFFVLRKYRGRGCGEWFARGLLGRFPGGWEIGETPENSGATAFWRKVLTRMEACEFVEHFVQNEAWHGPVQVVRISHSDSLL